MARRIRVIDFPVTFDEAHQDHELPNRLLAEASGILNWGLEGYAEWKRQGLNPPERIKAATTAYRADNDVVGRFIESCCVEAPSAKATTGKLYDAYKAWCFDTALEPIPIVMFGKELSRRGLVSKRERAGNAWRGIRLRGEWESKDEDA